MHLANNLVINIYSITILIIVCIHSSKQEEKESLQHKLYMKMLQLVIIMLVVDILSRFDGKPDTIYPFINSFGNIMIYLLSPILPSLWLLYVHDQITQDEKKTRQLIYPLLGFNVIYDVFLLLTPYYGFFYYIDSDNIYHRGPYFGLCVLIIVFLMLIAFFIIVLNRQIIDKKRYFSLLFFSVPPFICIILQIIFYGISIILNSVVLSLLIVFLNIQNQNIYTDYLTGLYNRKKLEIYLKGKINASTADKSFSAIMLDLNNFKSINDTFGHNIGDNALQISAKLLENCLRSNDFIARFGGDEFCIVLDVMNMVDLEEIVHRINLCFEKYNESKSTPYQLGFSMGYAVYDYYSHMGIEEFQKHIDLLMYQNKHVKKKAAATSS